MSGLWWDDEDYPNLKKRFDRVHVVMIREKSKKLSQANALGFLIDFYEKRHMDQERSLVRKTK